MSRQSRQSILEEVREWLEKRDTDNTEEDDCLSRSDWVVEFLGDINLTAVDRHDGDKWREGLISLAAEALAAVESYDRQAEPWRKMVRIAQEVANKAQERVLILNKAAPRIEKGGGRSTPHCVLESQASAWEKSSCVHIVDPE